MHDYVILNEINSKNITGLMINILPPITKPPIRNEVEEIDGRDGDIVTKLGYGAYDKEVEIGLYGNYDIDEVIAFFNGEGNVVFSNEPDKYYKYQILEQIDYEKLLKFKTAVVIFHVQPFKFELDEEEIVNETPIITGNGSDITLEDTVDNNIISIALSGNTHQKSLSGKNLFPTRENFTGAGITITNNEDGTYNISGTASSNIEFTTFLSLDDSKINDSNNFTLSSNKVLNGVTSRIEGYNDNTWVRNILGTSISSSTPTVTAIPNLTNVTRIRFGIFIASGTTVNMTNVGFQLEQNSVATDFEEYCGATPSPNPDYPQDIEVVTGYNEIEVVGKNKFNIGTGTNTAQNVQIIKNGSEISFNGTANASNYLLNNISLGIFKAGTYTFSMTKKSGSVSVPDDEIVIYNGSTTYLHRGIYYAPVEISFTLNETTELFCKLWANSGISYANCVINIQLEEGSATSYEPYQSQSYELNLGKNLFDKDNANVLNALLAEGARKLEGNGNGRTLYIQCKPNTKYTISKISSTRFRIDERSEVPTINSTNVNLVVNDIATNITYTTSSNAKYLLLTYYFSVSDTTITEQEILDTIQIEEGSATPYSAYKTPIEMCKIPNTDYKDEFRRSSGKNILDIENLTFKNGYYNSNGTWSSANNNSDIEFVPVLPNEQYTLSLNRSIYIITISEFNDNQTFIQRITGNTNISKQTITTSSTTKYLAIVFNLDGSTTITKSMVESWNPQLELGTQATDLEPFGVGVWYKYAKIGKVVLDGSESGWSYNSANNYFGLSNYITDYLYSINNITYLCDYYTPVNQTQQDTVFNTIAGDYSFNFKSNAYLLRIRDINYSTLTDFKTRLSSNPITLYYVLQTPTIETLDTELQTQLEDIYNNAKSYLGQTNITDEYVEGNQPFIMDVSVTGDSSVIITNKGNTTAKPIFTLYGSGNIGIYLNGNQLFNVSLGDEEYITFDIENMNAYKDTILKNRLVTGNYSNFLLNPGENKISFSGDVFKFEIINYSRWL